MVRSIGVVSAKGGVGKTVSTLNISGALMQLGKDVVVLDADIKASGLSLQLGMFHFPYTLNDVLEKKSSLLEAMYIHSSGLRIIPASLYLRNTKLSKLSSVLKDQALEDSIIMVDAPPGMESNSQAVIRACDEAIIITTPELPSVADVMKSIAYARRANTKITGMIINRYKKRSSEQLSPKEIQAACGVPILGVIPEDDSISKGIFRGSPGVFINPYSGAAVNFKKIAARITDSEYNEEKVLLKRIIWKMKRK